MIASRVSRNSKALLTWAYQQSRVTHRSWTALSLPLSLFLSPTFPSVQRMQNASDKGSLCQDCAYAAYSMHCVRETWWLAAAPSFASGSPSRNLCATISESIVTDASPCWTGD